MKLFVYGCSFSDRFGDTTHCYGDVLSKKLNIPYSHFGVAKCGSNDRIIRLLTHDVIEKNITPDDLVLIQYTIPHRKEFITWIDPEAVDEVHEAVDDYYLIRYKFECHKWHSNKKIKSFLKLYDEYMSVQNFNNYNFKLENIRLQTLLEHYNINACILGLSCYAPLPENMDYSIPYFKDRIYWNTEIGQADNERYAPDDPLHLSTNGHTILAEQLYDWLKEKGHINV